MKQPLRPGLIEDDAKYRQGWHGGLPETPCGYGSRRDQTEIQRQALARWVREHDIRTIADIGAGDLNWIGLVEWPHPVEYRAYDLVPRKPEVQAFDIVAQIAPQADLLLCLWVLNHFPLERAQQALRNLQASGSKWLAYTWWPAMDDSLDVGFDDKVSIRPRIQAELRLVRC